MIMSQEQAILKGQVHLEQMSELVRQAARDGRPIDQVERELWQQLLELGRFMVQDFVTQQGTGDLGPTIEYQGRTLRRLDEPHQRRYVSVFGEVTIQRTVYGTRETQKHEIIPLDARLGLPDGDFSYLLQEWDQAFCVQGSYEKSRQTVQRVLGIGQSVRSLEQMNVSMANSVESFRDSQPSPPPQEEGSILVLTADCKGVPMRRDAGQGPTESGVRRKKGEKANKKRMACVGAVYSIEPFVRSAQQVVDDVLRAECRDDRPTPQHKRMRAELTRSTAGVEENGKDRIFSWFSEQVSARTAAGGKPVVCVMDGERALWSKLKLLVGSVVCILDLFHVLERLWQAAYCFHPEGSEEAKEFVAERLRRILEGEVGYVLGGLKQKATKQRLRGRRAEQLRAVIGYLERNRGYMHYDEYLAAGYPIGSGVAEGACRHLVKDRMELTGMRWRVGGAQAMLDLRGVYLNDEWDVFQAHRVAAEQDRLYPYRQLILSKTRQAA